MTQTALVKRSRKPAMKQRTTWDYYQAQQIVRRRLHREWDPPAAPRGTPISRPVEKQNGRISPDSGRAPINDMPINSTYSQRFRLCYVCQLPGMELPIGMPRPRIPICSKLNKSTQSPRNKPLDLPPAGKPDLAGAHRVSVILLQYNGPEQFHRNMETVSQDALTLREDIKLEMYNNFIEASQRSAFHIELPQLRLKVGNLVPEQYLLHCHRQKNKDMSTNWKP